MKKSLFFSLMFLAATGAIKAEHLSAEFRNIEREGSMKAEDAIKDLHVMLDEAIGYFEGAAEKARELKKHVSSTQKHKEVAMEAHNSDKLGKDRNVKGKPKAALTSYKTVAENKAGHVKAHVDRVHDEAKRAHDKAEKAVKEAKKDVEAVKEKHDDAKKALADEDKKEHDEKTSSSHKKN